MIQKDCKLSLDSIETKDNGSVTITGYFAAFDNLDSDGDIFQKGAFKKSVAENSGRIMHLLQHDPSKPIARPTLSEDEKGLRFTSEITKGQMQVGYIADTVNLYKSGVFNEHSVGFQTINQKSEGEANIITEVKLWEGSTVTWGANHATPLESIKNLKNPNDIIARLDVVSKALRTGGLTDETYISLEREIEAIKALIEPRKHSEPQEEKEQLINVLSKFL